MCILCKRGTITDLTSVDFSNCCSTVVSLPKLSKNLISLKCYNCKFLFYLPDFPESLTELDCSLCPRLTFLPILPKGLKKLNCSGCLDLISLFPKNSESLPKGLELLDCTDCRKLNLELNNFQSLKILRIPGHILKSFHKLPPCLEELVCPFTNIDSLPALPKTLKILDCSNSFIAFLPELPGNLVLLNCNSTRLSKKPAHLKALIYCNRCVWLDPTFRQRQKYFNHLLKLQKFIRRFLKRRRLRLFSVFKHLFPKEICNIILENVF